MPTWGEILEELQAPVRDLQQRIQRGQAPPQQVIVDFDGVRRKYLRLLFEHTKRPVILYAANWTSLKPGLEPDLVTITPEDMQGFMEVMHGVPEGSLDLIMHSPGGSAEAAEALVSYIRSKFTDVRIFVPHAAMSAATMLACSANRIVMGKHSFLGPIDPQFIIQTELGRRSVAAHAIIEQFEQAKKECSGNPAALSVWVPILRQYGPALIVQCNFARELSESLVAQWLLAYMLAGQNDAELRAKEIAHQLASHADFKSHSRFIDRSRAKALGLVIDDLESDQTLQDLVLSVFHAASHTFATPCVKLIENHLGKAFIKTQQQLVVVPPQGSFPQPPPMPQR